LRIDFLDGAVHIGAGEMFVVPKGSRHKPYAENEVKLLLIEARTREEVGPPKMMFGYEADWEKPMAKSATTVFSTVSRQIGAVHCQLHSQVD
jgi:uncharacterized RmlC-like cupin family protein